MTREDVLAQAVSIAEDYLGPAAERFIYRLVRFHLEKDPAKLTKKDLPKLAEWVKVSLGLLTNDKQLVDDCERRLLKLAD